MFFVATTSTHTYVRWLLWFLVVFDQHLGVSMCKIQVPAVGAARLADEVRKRIYHGSYSKLANLVWKTRDLKEIGMIFTQATVYSIGSRENTSRKSSYHLIPRESTLRNPKRSYCKIQPLYLVNRTAQSVSKARTVMILLWGAPLAVVYKWRVCCRPPRSNFIDDTKDFKKNHLFKILDVLLDIIGFIRKKRWKS